MGAGPDRAAGRGPPAARDRRRGVGAPSIARVRAGHGCRAHRATTGAAPGPGWPPGGAREPVVGGGGPREADCAHLRCDGHGRGRSLSGAWAHPSRARHAARPARRRTHALRPLASGTRSRARRLGDRPERPLLHPRAPRGKGDRGRSRTRRVRQPPNPVRRAVARHRGDERDPRTGTPRGSRGGPDSAGPFLCRARPRARPRHLVCRPRGVGFAARPRAVRRRDGRIAPGLCRGDLRGDPHPWRPSSSPRPRCGRSGPVRPRSLGGRARPPRVGPERGGKDGVSQDARPPVRALAERGPAAARRREPDPLLPSLLRRHRRRTVDRGIALHLRRAGA